MKFGIYLLQRGLIDANTFVNAIELQVRQRPLLGALAIELGKLSMHDVFEILGDQADSQLPFGKIAVQKQLMSREDLAEIILLQLERTKPLVDILVDMGVMNQGTADEELARFRSIISVDTGTLDDSILANQLSQDTPGDMILTK